MILCSKRLIKLLFVCFKLFRFLVQTRALSQNMNAIRNTWLDLKFIRICGNYFFMLKVIYSEFLFNLLLLFVLGLILSNRVFNKRELQK